MFERIIYRALENAIGELTADPAGVERIFAVMDDLDAAESKKARETWTKLPPNVVLGYPRKDQKYPLFAVVLVDERETLRVIGDEVGFAGEDADLRAADPRVSRDAEVKTSFEEPTYNILVYAANMDVCFWYYNIAKYVLRQARDSFYARGATAVSFAGGDIGVDKTYLPEFLFARRLTVHVQRETRVIGAAVPRGRRVAGIATTDRPTVQDGAGGIATVDARVSGFVDVDDLNAELEGR